MLLDKESPKPLHKQLEDIIIQKIDDEEWTSNFMIPSENELAKDCGISRMTVRNALNRLVVVGLLYRVGGKGTFVSEPKIVSKPLSQMGIRDQLEQLGYEILTKLISIEKHIAPINIAKALDLNGTPMVYVIKRVRYIKGVPFSFHTSYIPMDLCPELETKKLEDSQLCDILEKEYNYEIIRIAETLETVFPTHEEETILLVKDYNPLLLLSDTVYTHEDIVIEYSKVVFRGDKIKLSLEFNK